MSSPSECVCAFVAACIKKERQRERRERRKSAHRTLLDRQPAHRTEKTPIQSTMRESVYAPVLKR